LNCLTHHLRFRDHFLRQECNCVRQKPDIIRYRNVK
jgi:hypothetical protein